MRHSNRKLRTYEEIYIVFTKYLRCGVYRFLSAGGNDCYGRTRERATRLYESSCALTDALAQETRLDFGLRENARRGKADCVCGTAKGDTRVRLV